MNKYFEMIFYILIMVIILLYLLVLFFDYDSMIIENEKYCDGKWFNDDEKYYCHSTISNREITQTWNKNIIWELFR